MSRVVDDLLRKYENLGDQFTPEEAIKFYRENIASDDLPSHIMADLAEGLLDENRKLNRRLSAIITKTPKRRKK